MSATCTRYAVPGWGIGELWMSGGVILAHDFDFVDAGRESTEVDRPRVRARLPMPAIRLSKPPKGAVSPPTGTVAAKSSRVGYAFAPTSHKGREHGPSDTQAELRANDAPNGPGSADSPARVAARVAEYLAGAAVPLADVELDLSWATGFQRAVVDALRAVPRGQVVTYGELAALAGRPGAARAAGSYCAKNPFALFVPCHRVVSASGIGGYGATGVHVKRRLLALEGVVA